MKLTKEEQKKVVKEQVELLNHYDRQRRSYENEWNTIYKLYNAYVDKKNYPWKSNLFIPIVFQMVENILPRYINGTVYFDYSPKTSDDVEKARAMNLLVNDYQLPKMKYFYKQILLLKQEILYGTSWAFPRWCVKSRIQPTSKTTKLMFDKKQVNKPYYEGPEIEVADCFHVWGDARADDETKSTAIIYEDSMNLDQFMKEYEDDLKEMGHTRTDLEKSFNNMRNSFDVSRYDLMNSRSYSGHNKVSDVILMRVFYDNRWVIIANRDLLIADMENPLLYPGKPTCRIVSMPMKGELYGKSILSMIKSLQFELNDIRNQRIDNVKLVMDRMYIAARNSTLNKDQLATAPGRIIWVDDPEEVATAIQPMNTPDVTQSGLFEEDKIYRDLERTSGLTDFQTGIGEVESATVGSILESKLNTRIEAKVKTIAYSGLYTLGMIIACLNEQYLKEEIALRVLGPDGKWSFPESHKINPSQITSFLDLNVRFQPDQSFRKPVNLQNMMQMLPYAKSDPNIDMRNYWQEMFDLMKMENASKLFATDKDKPKPYDDRVEAHLAREENNLINIGQSPKPNQNDNHQVHLLIHNLAVDQAKTPDQRDRYRQHIGLHEQYLGGQGYVEQAGIEEASQMPPEMAQAMQAGNALAQGQGFSQNSPIEQGEKRAYTRGHSTNIPYGKLG